MKYFTIFLVLIGFTVYVFAESSEFTIAQVHWLKDSHSADGFAVIQVVDPDMNLSSKDIEKFENAEALKEQLHQDMKKSKELL